MTPEDRRTDLQREIDSMLLETDQARMQKLRAEVDR